MTDLAAIWPAAGPIRRWPTETAWRAARLRGLGASDVPKLMGLSPHGGPWSVWAPRMADYETNGSAVTGRGHWLEGPILHRWAEQMGCPVVGPLGPTHVVGPAPLACTPDGAAELWGEWAPVEVKTDRSRAQWGPSGTTVHSYSERHGIVRDDYYVQVLVQLVCTGAPFGVLVVLRSMDDLRWYIIHRDERAQRAIVAKCRAWWATHIEGRQPPQVDDTDACRAALARLQPPTGRTGPALDYEATFAEGLARMRAQRKALDANIQRASTVLAAQMGGRGLDRIEWGDRRRPNRATRVVRRTEDGASVGVQVTIREDRT